MTATVESLGEATPDDLVDLVHLIELLGYSVDAERLAARLGHLDSAAGYETWVVRDEGGRISAVAGGHVLWAYNADRPAAQLMLLVVREDARREGLGSQLLSHFEAWARSHDAASLAAVSAAARENAHRFYQKRGYHAAGSAYTKMA
ncbi:GNAT family N-acetyltransferase [Frondihabitans australicus]|uniref:Acetyltransferase (GNAT) family protein n=1 Tax=Frondihabitans australicus TaxID=386892 RepID=A0A495IDL9_9MICO|nr:GNAT family N-acetyltransferase [Frondihabitans australicus]RKR73730.1 acetyltransferase (GNAT) family protein [Frondihabitans australicus]